MSIAEPQAIATDQETILAVDDNEQNLQLLQEYLWSWDYDVVVAHDGREAIDLFKQVNPSAIVLDVMMPNMDGYEACTLIKSLPAGRTTPILMLTALTGSEDKIKALESGADDFLNKPINREELRARIRSLIKIRNLRKELDSSENIIMTLTTALENKDPRSGGHVHRVASYAAKLSDALGLTAAEREIIIKGSMLHDLGKIGVPDTILSKANRSDEERRLVERHTATGAAILGPMRTFQDFLPIVRWHHERWDGQGYPDTLAGESIPLEARIVGIADRFDEIHHEDERSEAEALAQLKTESESGAFDPELVDIFAATLHEESVCTERRRHLIKRERPGTRVLCVDDNAMNRDLMRTLLADEGYEVFMATNGREAITAVDEQSIDIVILDLIMPVQDGITTLRSLRADSRHEFLPVIVLTSQRSNQARQEAIVAGADDFISYPMNRLELLTRLQSLIRLKNYHADLEQTQNVICALALALEAKDRYTRGHSQRVGDLARQFALFLGMSPAVADRARIAGLLHDIGKIAVPEALLNKEGPLTRDEFLRVIDHPVVGEEMVRPLMTLTSVLGMIRHHHERFDGRGYPDGLKGDAIPVEVRLLSIVDAYDALTSHRSYRPAPLTHDAALVTLRREAAGGKWDPVMVDRFASMLGDAPPDWARIENPIPALPT